MNRITITRPDDWHLHLRDKEILKAVLPASARVYGRAMIMPNLIPPVASAKDALRYRAEIMEAMPEGSLFKPLMTCYLTDSTKPSEISKGYTDKAFIAAKLFPAGATTNSENGVTAIEHIFPVLETMQKIGMPLSVHGEVTDPDIDIFDREKVFIDRILIPVRKAFPELKIIFEHLSSKDAVDYVLEINGPTVATITPHHLLLTRNDIFKGGIRAFNYCLPIVKTAKDRDALIKAATSGKKLFFLGTDSAPHLEKNKIKDGAAAGIFNAPNSIEYVTQAFDNQKKLDNLEKFTSLNGAEFYGLKPNQDTITLIKNEKYAEKDLSIRLGKDNIRSFEPTIPLHWEIEGLKYNQRTQKYEIKNVR